MSGHQSRSEGLVDEPPYDVSERTKNKLYLALALMYLLIFGLSVVPRFVFPSGGLGDSTHQPLHQITFLYEPANYTYYVELEFYGSQQDALAEQDSLAYVEFVVGPGTTTRSEDLLYLPLTTDLFWVRVHLCKLLDVEESWYSLQTLRIGNSLMCHVGGHDFTILVERMDNG